MILHLTKKLSDKLKVTSTPQPVEDDLFSWRANYVRESGLCFVVFMNDATRFTIAINDAKAAKLKKLDELFFYTLRETLLAHGINPEVIECYIQELGEITYAKNADKKRTAQLNKNVETVWWALRNHTDDVDLSVFSNGMIYNTSGVDEVIIPEEKMIEMLGRYGKPVRKFRAFDIIVRLDLDGKDAIRKLRVPANILFVQLHKLLQITFDWHNYHLYSFGLFKEWSDNYYAIPDVELVLESDQYDAFETNPDAVSMTGKKLSDYVPEYRKILYCYDFGDDWRHYIEVENIIDDCSEELPVLLSGHGDSPPEDVGGPGGYEEFLEVIANPKHPEYEHLTGWAKSQRWKHFDYDLTARLVKSNF